MLLAQRSTPNTLDLESLVDYVNCRYVRNYIESLIERNAVDSVDRKNYVDSLRETLSKVTIETPLPYEELRKRLSHKWSKTNDSLASIINERKIELASGTKLVKIVRIVSLYGINKKIADVLIPTRDSVLEEIDESFFNSMGSETVTELESEQAESMETGTWKWIIGAIITLLLLTIFIQRRSHRNRRNENSSLRQERHELKEKNKHLEAIIARQQMDNISKKERMNSGVADNSYASNHTSNSSSLSNILPEDVAHASPPTSTTDLERNMKESKTVKVSERSVVYKYLKHPNDEGYFEQEYDTPSDKCFFKYREHEGRKEFEFDGDVGYAVANYSAILQDACISENDYHGAIHIKTTERGILNSELKITKKATIRFES
jgi:hypothetical protein